MQGHHLLKAAGRRDAAEAKRALQHQADPDLPDAGLVLPIECPSRCLKREKEFNVSEICEPCAKLVPTLCANVF